jgi:hypothetical protein
MWTTIEFWQGTEHRPIAMARLAPWRDLCREMEGAADNQQWLKWVVAGGCFVPCFRRWRACLLSAGDSLL